MEGTGEIDENDTGDTMVQFRPTDADGDESLKFYVEGVNREHFRVVSAGFKVYALQVTDAFDYEMTDDGMISVTVTVADSAGLSDTATFNVTVNDLNDNAPVITATGSAAIDENASGSTGLMVDVTDADTVGGDTTWTVSDDRFEIDAMGNLSLKAGLDYDGDDGVKSVMLTVTASDGANSSMAEAITVTINPVNDNTPMISVAGTQVDLNEMDDGFEEATPTGFTASVTDGDGDKVPPMVSGDSRFEIDATTGNLMIVAGSKFNYENASDRSIALQITAEDAGGLAAESQSVTVKFMNVNDSDPTLAVTDLQAGTRQPQREGVVSASTQVGYRIVVSDDDTDADNPLPMPMVKDDRFEIDAQGYLTIKAGSEFDFEGEGSSIALEITANDGRDDATATATYTITFNIANVDEPPVVTGERESRRASWVRTETATRTSRPSPPRIRTIRTRHCRPCTGLRRPIRTRPFGRGRRTRTATSTRWA